MSTAADIDVFFGTAVTPASQLNIAIGSVVLHEVIGSHCTFAIECLSLDEGDPAKRSGSQPALDALLQQMGGELLIVARSPSRGDARRELDFKGLVTRVRAARQRGGGQRVILEGHSRTILLDEGPHFTHIIKQTDALFADELIKFAANFIPGLCDVKLGDASKQIVDYGMLWGETLFNFMVRVAERAGVWGFYDGDKFLLREAPLDTTIALTMASNQDDNALDSFSIESGSVLADTVTSMLAWAERTTLESETDFKQLPGGQHAWTKSAQLRPIGEGDKFTRLIADTRHFGQAELDRHMKLFQETTVCHAVTAHGTSSNATIRIGKQLDLQGISPDQTGKYVVGRVTHFMDALRGSYSNEFEAFPAAGARPAWNHDRPPAMQLYQGTVVDEADMLSKTTYTKEALDSVKVRLSFQTLGHIRARVAMPYAGAASGFFTMPEVGDEVAVMFMEGDPSRAVVVGSLFNGNKSKLFDQLKGLEKNEGKGLLTIGDNKILIQDGAGKSITISSPGSISINAGGDISITAGGNISVKATKKYTQNSGALTSCHSDDDAIHTATNIGIGAQEVVNITGKKGFLTGSDFTEVGKKKVVITGSDSVKIKPKDVGVEASDRFTVESGFTLITGDTAVTTKSGGSVISVKPDGIKEEAPLIKLNP